VDLLDAEIKRFLSRLGPVEGEHVARPEPIEQLGYLTQLETIGDSIDKNLSELVVKRVRLGVHFSPEAAAEIDEMFSLVRENLQIAEGAFVRRDLVLAHQLFRHRQHLDSMTAQLRDEHFA